jgi:16S rRNA (guanine527-N7)-methyltransferase
MTKRSKFLIEVLEWPGSPDALVVNARAEEAARWPELDGVFDLVTARSFGAPSVTAECAVRFLKVGGALVVSEPPDDAELGRWSPSGLGELGLKDLGRTRKGSAFRVLVKERATALKYPRESGVPKKKPLF